MSSNKTAKAKTKAKAKAKTKTKAKNEQCYIVYGTGFNPMKIKGIDARNKLMMQIKNKGFAPKYTATCRSCTRKATLYGRI